MTRVGARPCAPGGRRIPAEMWDALAEAAKVREAAAAEARTMVDAAAAESDSIRSAAAARGREEGLASAAETLARAAAERDRLLAATEPEVIHLAFAIAARVVSRAAERDPDVAVEIAGCALEAARNGADVTLRVHPDDLSAVREAEPRLLSQLIRARRIALREDVTVGRGGAVVETEAVTIDARLDTQLEGLRRALAGEGA